MANNNVARVPSFTSRRAETSVELASGQSIAIAGMFSNSMRNAMKEFPGLADLPILGALFRSTEFQREETELVIIVTPYIVKPSSTSDMASPLETLRYATHLEMILWGRLNSVEHFEGAGDAMASSDELHLVGTSGFYVE